MTGIVIYSIVFYLLAGLGASLGYHRILAHRSAELAKWFEYCLVIVGLPLGTPIQWVGNHRAHHTTTDVPGDPHSPHVDGFWYAHCGWYIHSKNTFLCMLYALAGPIRMLIDSFMRPRTNQQHIHLAKDVSADKVYAFVSRPLVYMFIMWIYLIILLLVPYLIFGWKGVLIASILMVVIYNIGDSVDSIGHLIGGRRGKDKSRNNLILGYLAYGDGWHANHHQDPVRARHGNKWYQFDLSYSVLRVFEIIGIVKKIH